MNTMEKTIKSHNFLKIMFRMNIISILSTFPCPSNQIVFPSFFVLVTLLLEWSKL